METETINRNSGQDALSRLHWIASDRYRLWFHLGFWLFIFIDEVLAIVGLTEPLQIGYYKLLLIFIINVITVYFNLYVLIPTYFLKNKIFLYVSFTIISILLNVESTFLVKIYSSGDEFLEFPSHSTVSILLSDLVYTSFMLATAVGANSLRRFIISLDEIRNLENSKLRTELKFLKDQINPHFLFNSLNNIYVQTRKRPKEASESILLLSDIFHYQLYDCAQEKVHLEKEINYLKNFLKLDRIRKSETEINFTIDGEIGSQMVAPNIFNTFVENAVKHGLSNKKNTFIDISFKIDGEEIIFVTKNTIYLERRKNREDEKGGIGLKNVKRRLELIYPERHELKIDSHDGIYEVYLKMNLD